jgi:hypothetical protein
MWFVLTAKGRESLARAQVIVTESESDVARGVSASASRSLLDVFDDLIHEIAIYSGPRDLQGEPWSP